MSLALDQLVFDVLRLTAAKQEAVYEAACPEAFRGGQFGPRPPRKSPARMSVGSVCGSSPGCGNVGYIHLFFVV